jgi:nicotinate phosphoribosyltransferase
MRTAGQELKAIRLDSGNLAELSMECRALLNRDGFGGVRILASGALDEYSIDELLRVRAPIDGFGVGTKVGVSEDAPWADSVYKIVAYDGRPAMKLSDDKETMPGSKQVYRYYSRSGQPLRDIMATASEPRPSPGARPVLTEVMKNGEITVDLPDLGELRSRFGAEFAQLDRRYKRLHNPDAYEVTVSDDLSSLHANTAARLRQRSGAKIGGTLTERT